MLILKLGKQNSLEYIFIISGVIPTGHCGQRSNSDEYCILYSFSEYQYKKYRYI